MAPTAHERPRLRFTVDDVQAMVRAGILREDEHIELIDGELVPLRPQGRPHEYLTGILRRRLEVAYGRRAYALDHSPLRVDAHHLPEPDIVVYRGDIVALSRQSDDDEEPLLVIEIAATGQREDAAKAALYARRGVPVYWLIDLASRRVSVYERPAPDGYRSLRVLGEDESVTVPEHDEVWPVCELLPPADAPLD